MCKNKQFHKQYVHARYIQHYISLNSSADMQDLKLFPNVKEVQEAFSIYHHILSIIYPRDNRVDVNNPKITTICAGDGVSPRVAGLLSFMTKWTSWSIDPLMRVEKYDGKINRCKVIQDIAENINNYYQEGDEEVVLLIFPHSHVENTNEVYKHFKHKNVWIISMPCCYPSQDNWLPLKTWIGVKDDCINSDKNILKFYCNYLNL